MSREGFEPTIPWFEWAKTVHASDHAATVTGHAKIYFLEIKRSYTFAMVGIHIS
jgi:hypothetical protein